MDEYSYSVLYKKEVLEENKSYVFMPCYVIKGLYDEDEHIFLDELNNCRYSYSDINIINDSSDYCVGEVYKEEELQDKYQTARGSIEELLIMLFEESQKYATVGHYNQNSTKIEIQKLEIENEDENENNDFISENDYYNSLKERIGEDFSMFLRDDIDYIMESEDIDDIKKYIKKIKDNKASYEKKLNDCKEPTLISIIFDHEVNKFFYIDDLDEIKDMIKQTFEYLFDYDEEYDIDINVIKRTIDVSYNAINEVESVEDANNVLESLIQLSTSMLDILDNYNRREIYLPKSTSYFKHLVQEIHSIKNEHSLDQIRLKYSNFYNDTRDSLDMLEDEFLVINKEPSVKQDLDMKDEDITSIIDYSMEKINSLVGLENVKEAMGELFDTIWFKFKTQKNLCFDNETKHMVFTGNPGTGKTTVASIIAPLFYKLGYLTSDKVAFVSAQDLVAGYVGQTAIKTEKIIKKNKGGLIVLDEAYILAGEAQEFGNEAVTVLLKEMEKNETMFIFAGYTKEMNDFVKMNSGLESRIGTYLEFRDYNDKELLEIFNKNLNKVNQSDNKKYQLKISSEGLEKVKKVLHDAKKIENFGNGRFVKKLFDAIIKQHAKNVRKTLKEDALYLITGNDIPEDITDKIIFNGSRDTKLYSSSSIGFNRDINNNQKTYIKKKYPTKGGFGG